MIYDTCPECGCAHLSTHLSGPFRHNEQSCYMCGWTGERFEPEARAIKLVKRVAVFHAVGHTYEIFDRYGQPYVQRSCPSREEALEELKHELEQLNSREGGRPWVGTLWPDSVVATGEIVR